MISSAGTVPLAGTTNTAAHTTGTGNSQTTDVDGMGSPQDPTSDETLAAIQEAQRQDPGRVVSVGEIASGPARPISGPPALGPLPAVARGPIDGPTGTPEDLRVASALKTIATGNSRKVGQALKEIQNVVSALMLENKFEQAAGYLLDAALTMRKNRISRVTIMDERGIEEGVIRPLDIFIKAVDLFKEASQRIPDPTLSENFLIRAAAAYALAGLYQSAEQVLHSLVQRLSSSSQDRQKIRALNRTRAYLNIQIALHLPIVNQGSLGFKLLKESYSQLKATEPDVSEAPPPLRRIYDLYTKEADEHFAAAERALADEREISQDTINLFREAIRMRGGLIIDFGLLDVIIESIDNNRFSTPFLQLILPDPVQGLPPLSDQVRDAIAKAKP